MKLSILIMTAAAALEACTVAQPALNVPSPQEITVEAYVDGPSTLHLASSGVYWTNGGNAKPGRLGAHNYPTYINGKSWMPKWGKDGDDRGNDKSDVYPFPLSNVEYEMDVIGVSERRGSGRKDRRTPPTAERAGGELLVHIPDPEVGARWYKLRLRLRKS